MGSDTPRAPAPLHERLIAEACAALRDAGFVDPDDGTMPTFVDRPYPEGRMDVWKHPESAARAVLGPVLRILGETAHRMSSKQLLEMARKIESRRRRAVREDPED